MCPIAKGKRKILWQFECKKQWIPETDNRFMFSLLPVMGFSVNCHFVLFLFFSAMTHCWESTETVPTIQPRKRFPFKWWSSKTSFLGESVSVEDNTMMIVSEDFWMKLGLIITGPTLYITTIVIYAHTISSSVVQSLLVTVCTEWCELDHRAVLALFNLLTLHELSIFLPLIHSGELQL